jgi:uncharacterized protein YktB (UPF0637 family)
MEKSNHSFLKSLALAFGDGLLFGVAVKLAQGPSKPREESMTDLGRLAERLKTVEDRIEETHGVNRDALAKLSEGLDGRVLEKVILALEARLSEHIGQVDRHLAEMDAQVALDLKAWETQARSHAGSFEKAMQQIESRVCEYVETARQHSTEQISGVDQKLSALQEALPAKFREIVDAVRQSLEARLALEVKELESRQAASGVAPEQIRELETKLRAEVEGVAGKLATLREELPPKLRQIVEAVETAMEARIADGDSQLADQLAGIQKALSGLRQEIAGPAGADAVRQSLEGDLRRYAEQLATLDRKLITLQETLPPKIKEIMDAVRDSLDTRIAVEAKGIEERQATQLKQFQASIRAAQDQFREELKAESKTASLEEEVARLRTEMAAAGAKLEQSAAQVGALDGKLTTLQEELPPKIKEIVDAVRQSLDARIAAEVSGLTEQYRAGMQQIETGFRAEREAENLPGKLTAAVDGLMQSMERKLAGEIQALEARAVARSSEIEKAIENFSLLEDRLQTLEQKLQQGSEEAADRAAERVWHSIEERLLQRGAPAPPPTHPAESVTELRQKSSTAEQSVLDLIAGIGQLFERTPAPRETAPAAQEAAPERQPPEPTVVPVAALDGTEAATPEPEAEAEPEPPAAMEEPAQPALQVVPAPSGDDVPEEASVVLLFRPKQPGRKWRIPFVSSLFLM